jgi:CMP-N-acetylneuraminic acid synthetase
MPFDGVPMVVRAIRTADACGLFDVIVVSSEDDHILQLARDAGAVPMLRSREMAGDNITDAELIFEIVRPFRNAELFCCLYPCTPLLRPGDIVSGYYRFMEHPDRPLRVVNERGEDAGAFYFFTWPVRGEYRDCFIPGQVDINTKEDLDHAKQLYESRKVLE